MAVNIYVIRHGQASFGADNYDCLSDSGRRQSQFLGKFLDQVGVEFSAVYTGAMKRQIETAEIVLANLPSNSLRTITDNCFDEYDAAAIIKANLQDMIQEDHTYQKDMERLFTDQTSFRRIFDTAMSRWFSGAYDYPGVETWRQVSERISKGIDRIASLAKDDSKLAVFTSGGAIAACMQRSLGLTNEQARKVILRTANSSFSVFQGTGGDLTLISYNSVCHLLLNREQVSTI